MMIDTVLIPLWIKMVWKGRNCESRSLVVDYLNRSQVSREPTLFEMHPNLFTCRVFGLNDLSKGSADVNDS
jgi:hypothetical protein